MEIIIRLIVFFLPQKYIGNDVTEKANISGWGPIDNSGKPTNNLMSAELSVYPTK